MMTAKVATNPQEYVLQRSGLNPLKFSGTLIASSSGKDLETPENRIQRWHDIDLYQTVSGKYVIHIRYRSEWDGERNHDFANVFDPAETVHVLRSYNPIAYVEGFPPLPRYYRRQQRLLSWIKRRYEEQISDMLIGLRDDLFEVID